MKTVLLFLFAFSLLMNTYAQIEFQKHIIDYGIGTTYGFIPADVDGDSFIDVISADPDNETIYWYKNDGLGNFVMQNTIINSLAYNIYPVDFDGDNDIDIIWKTPNNEIAFSENIDGLGNFNNPQILISPVDIFYLGVPADIDGDNDLDIVCTFYTFSCIKWFENIDGQGNFGGSQIIKQFTNGSSYGLPILKDIDGDDDLDIAINFTDGVGWNDYGYICFLKNTNGLGSFEVSMVIPAGKIVSHILFDDIDGDNDLDMLCHAYYYLEDLKLVKVFINSNGEGTFEFQDSVNPLDILVETFHTSDIDGDGDSDIVCSVTSPNYSLIWYENSDGLGTFNESYLIDNFTDYHVYWLDSKDLNGDNNPDILAIRFNEISWYENLGSLSIDDNVLTEFTIYPNPTSGIVTIDSKERIIQINVSNSLGQAVLSNANEKKIDLSGLDQGLYIVKITDENGKVVIGKVLKE